MTAAYVAAVRGSGVKIVDTRKTTPLLRRYEKLAVRHGGGLNHRFALYDGILLKENHIVAAGGISNAVRKAVAGSHHLMKIGVEVTQISELDEAIEAGAESILLDNMDVERMKEAVQRAKGRDVVLEASGNVSLDSVRAIAQTGVDLISIGSLTHSAPAVDLSLVIANV
jgi:nicotinate-nucleotide pyrophosphorylase (carboxylating)